ncbi:Putative AMP-dependent synthetase/ligase, Condensation domain, phosphopantetheine binding ACP [Septoria linicola]|uniref:AMP-dependent synthetase/ligase, Condensation domain, phosphopantetheine binding ACP n=1 Tax=Septoria linicola TaxID=215465 RepID=A0A9Q9EQX3_9PEZI|nr:putative AMP-dependent synthetase/ligase, Condensation domain, phosphopantetheine binding ACP [Septoria linicola]USW59282.1 Putative AMP-dependent synthetase/ligase, Condensation domain, phosphopantetheine binding ACP [Septoria linicola]
MASPNPLARPTAFPRLDTLDHSQSTTAVVPGQLQQQRFGYHSNVSAAPRSRTALLHGYSRFIAAFTGDTEVCFQFSFRQQLDTKPILEVVEAEILDEQEVCTYNKRVSKCVSDLKPYTAPAAEPFGFGFELLLDPENFDSTHTSPDLDCPFVVQYHATQLSIIVFYDASLLDKDFFRVAFDVLVNELSEIPHVSTSEVPRSVLNHPPQSQPPSYTHSECAGATPSLLHAGFQRTAALHPGRHALHFHTSASEHIFSYAELDSLTSALAIKLRNHIQSTKASIGREVIVPAFMTGCPAFYISWLAVLKAGYAFCPLPTDAPPEQLRGIVEEVGASIVLCDGVQIGGRPWDAWYCDDDELATCLDVRDFISRYQEGTNSPILFVDALPEVGQSDLAYVMYTSGSTGKPKGVRIHHFAAACSIASHAKFIPAAYAKDGFRWFQFAAPTFDPSIMEIFTTWWTGGTLCGAPRDLLLTDPEAAINKLSATIMMATPSMASVLRPDKVPTLRNLWTMGEKLTPKVIQNFSSDSSLYISEASHAPRLQRPRKLLNAYGPTEGSINCNIASDFSANERGSIIGKPVDTCSIIVIDSTSRRPVPVPLGFSGELAIGGPQVSQGYLNRPEQTAAAFVSSTEYGRLYRTGDRARVVKNKSGELTVEFLGRITTDQVKLSGRRVELGQIESAVAAVAGVTDVVAIVHSHGTAGQGSEQVVACIARDGSVDEEELRNDCHRASEASLAPFMRPAKYIFLDSMPRSRSGKTDRKALKAVAAEQWKNAEGATAPSALSVNGNESALNDPVMVTIIQVLAETCDVSASDITPTTDLLSIGLDSLRAVKFLQGVREHDIDNLSVANVLASRTPAGMASYCSGGDIATVDTTARRLADWDARFAEFNKKHLDACAKRLSVLPTEFENILPTTATQSGMIASFYRSVSKQTTSSTRKPYINHSIYHESEGTVSAKLEQAWQTALSRPRILRTVFTPVDDELSPFAQCILTKSSGTASLSIHKYSCASADSWNETLDVAQKDAESAISLDRPPYRLSLIESPERKAYLLSLFHGIFDGGSLELITQDVERAYLDQDPLPRTEVDEAVKKHFSEATDASVGYWRSEFKDFESVPFPCVSASKPEAQSPQACVSEVIGNVSLNQLSAAAKLASVSPLSILQGAWASVLFAYTGTTSEISFGSVLSDRLEDALSACHGPTFVVAPVKLDHSQVSQKATRDVLSQLTNKNAESLPYHHIPLSSLATSEGTLPYDTLLAFQAFDRSAGESTLWQKVEFPAMEHDFAVMIEIWPTASGALRFRGTYTHQHLDEAAADMMLHQLDAIVGHICDEPNTAFLDTKSSLGHNLLSEFPIATEETLPSSDMQLHHAFEKHAAQNPDRSALVFRRSLDRTESDINWTYGRLSQLAQNFANSLLREFGPVENEPIMICMEKCPELYVAVLGVLKAGAGWCPIDPYSPPARQHAIMERTGSRILLLSSMSSTVEASAIPRGVSTFTIDLNKLHATDAMGDTLTADVKRDPSHLAYLIFTSGTTGAPKGVPITHGAGAIAMNALAEAVPSVTSTGQVRCMQFSQYTFDVFVQDLFYTWTLGGTLISSTRQILLQNFADVANDLEATHAHLTPAFSATLARSNIQTLEVVTMIGEKLTEAVAADWGADMRAFNTYGPAEVTVVSTLRQFTGREDTYHSANIGIPLPSVGTYVIDNGKVVMRGGIGELALSGPQLSPGYWKSPEVNAKKFIWNEQLQQRLYLTGDLVRHLADGTIHYVGRDDDLVKLGGQRVELGEIAFALKDADPRINKFEVLLCKRKEADSKAVVAFLACPSAAQGEQELKALINSQAKGVAELAREYASSVLPPYMIPSSFIVLPHIPRTASAKWEVAGNDTPDVTDQDVEWRAANKDLLHVIAQVLKVDSQNLRPNSSLPAIGIDSIGAIRLIPKINAIGFNLSVVDAFKCRSLSDLCRLANETARVDSPHAEDALPADHPDKVLQSFDARYYKNVSKTIEQDDFTVIPTTVLQESLLAESLRDPQAYWSSHVFRLCEDVDLAQLRRAWIKIARQTEALRAGFLPKAEILGDSDAAAVDDLSYLSIIYDEPHVDWTQHDLTGIMEHAIRQRVVDIAKENHERLFLLPPWAVDIFTRGSEMMMVLTISHVIYDGASLELLEAGVMGAYTRSAKTSPSLSLREAIASRSALDVDSGRTIDFWKTCLQDFDVSAAQSIADGQKLRHRILYQQSTETMDGLRKAAAKLEISSMVSIFRTAWALILSDLLESPHIAFAEILSDRVVDGRLANVIGPLMSTVPVLFKRQGTAGEAIIEQDRFSKEAWKHRNVRPSTVRSFLRRGPDSQVYPAVFAFHPSAGAHIQDDRQLWTRLDDVTSIEVEHPLAFNVWQEDDGSFKLELAVADQVMGEDEQRLLLRQVDALVAALAGNPQSDLASIGETLSNSLLSRTTPRQDTQCPSHKTTTHYVEHWAAMHPNWKAAEIVTKLDVEGTETQSWTYAELNAEANRIASMILQEGITKQMIGMCIGRTLMSFAVPLGILKSGNAYLPIDEALPAERKAFLLDDSGAAFIFTTPELFDGVAVPKDCRFIDVDGERFQQQLAGQLASNLPRYGGPRDNAYLLYTSGSTGKPKGVLVNQENLSSFVEAQSEYICDVTTTQELAGRGKYLGLASRAFDVHIGEMFLAWKHGLAITTGLKSMLLDDLALCLSSLHITHASFVPSLLDQTGLEPDDAPDLVFLGVGGEKMSPKTKKKWGSLERVGLINAYGPTEATIGCCSGRLYPDSDMRDIGLPLGDSIGHVLIPGTNHYALRGMPGELCFTGSLIANGYLNRPDAKGFVEDFHGQRMYRTGDIVKLRADDHVLFLGRKDDQVKIRGQRVELGEVAEGVREASDEPIDTAALVIKHPELSRQQLVAFEAQAGAAKRKGIETPPEVDTSQIEEANTTLRQNCQKSLPIFMVPDVIVPLDYIPLATTSGKADNKLLTKIFSETPMSTFAPGQQRSTAKVASGRPMNVAEQSVWNNIAPILKEKPSSITPSTSMFELGIDSLSAISVFSKLRKAGYECSVSMIMQNLTIEALAQSPKRPTTEDASRRQQIHTNLADMAKAFIQSKELPFTADTVETVRPCLPLQEVLVGQSMHQDADGSDGAYVNHMTFKIGTDIDVARLREAWETLVSSNEILRTCFATKDDTFFQVVLKSEASRLSWQDAPSSAEISLQSMQNQVARDIIENIWVRAPLRITLFREHGELLLLLSIHHAIYDGNSLQMMIKDVESIYRGQAVEARLSAQPLVEHIAGQEEERTKAHWSTLLSGWENAPLLNETGAKNISLNEVERRFSLKVSKLERQVTGLNVTLTTVLQAAFAIALSQTLHTNDVIFGNVLSGRTIPVENADNIMAPCIATIPARLRIDDVQQSVADVLTELQQANSASLEFQHVSPRAIQRWTKADRALYDCLFSFVRAQSHGNDSASLLESTGSTIAVDYPLAIEFEADAATDQLTVRAGFTEAFGTPAEASGLLEKVEMLVDTVFERSNLAVETLGLTASESQHIRKAVPRYDEVNWSPLERELKSLLSEYTGTAEVDIRKDSAFIHLGVDSISAIRFAKHLRNKGFKVSSADVIRHNRLGALADFLTPASGEKVNDEIPKNTTNGHGDDSQNDKDDEQKIYAALAASNVPDLDNSEAYYECTPLVAGMLTQSLATDGAFYMHHHAFRCKPDIDLERLRLAWNATVADLDVLRTTFHWLPEFRTPWVAVVHQIKKPDWQEVEVADANQHWLSLSATSDFAARVEGGRPLASVQIVHSQQDPVVILTLHHAIYDGMSIGMLYRQLAMRYLGIETPPLTPFYRAARAIAKVATPALKFWVDHVKGYEGAPVLNDEAERSFVLAERVITTDASLELKCLEADIEIKDVCVAAFGKAMACLHGRRDVVFGHVMAARTLDVDGGNDIVGPMFNTVPFRVSLKDSLQTNRDVVRTVHEVNTGSLEYQHASLAEVQKAWREDARDPSAPLIDSLFVYSKVDGGDGPGLLSLGAPLETDKSPVPSEYRLNFEVEHTPEGVTARALSSIPKLELDALLDRFSSAIHDILDKPSRYATAFPEELRTLPIELETSANITQEFNQDAVTQYAETIRNAMVDVAQVSADKIALDSSIYSFGIDSIAGIQIASRCRKAGLRISVADILKGGMLGRICEIVSAKIDQVAARDTKVVNGMAKLISPDQEQAALSLLKFGKDDVEEVLPVLPGQEYHLLSWLQSGRTLYEPGWSYRASQKLDEGRLREAWQQLRRRNAVLRTTFAATGPKGIVQVVLREAATTDDAFEVIHSDKTLTETAKERAFAEARLPSDFFALPVRLRLLKASDGDAVMVYFHHALYDAWSMPRLITELAAIYNGQQLDVAPTFSELVHHTLQSVDKEEEKEFWYKSLEGGQKAILPSISTPGGGQDRSQSFHMLEGTQVEVSEIERVCASHKISPHHVVLLAFARALARATSTSNPLFGFFQLGRSAAFDGIDHVTGPMVNTLPMTLASVLERNVLDAVQALQQVLAGRVPFEQSSLRSAVHAHNPAATQLPFNAYINLLWNKTALVGAAQEEDLFQPLALGVPTDYSSLQALPGRTAIDALDTSFLPAHQVFVDVGPGEKGIVFGVRADAALMGVEDIKHFVRSIESEVVTCMDALRG